MLKFGGAFDSTPTRPKITGKANESSWIEIHEAWASSVLLNFLDFFVPFYAVAHLSPHAPRKGFRFDVQALQQYLDL